MCEPPSNDEPEKTRTDRTNRQGRRQWARQQRTAESKATARAASTQPYSKAIQACAACSFFFFVFFFSVLSFPSFAAMSLGQFMSTPFSFSFLGSFSLFLFVLGLLIQQQNSHVLQLRPGPLGTRGDNHEPTATVRRAHWRSRRSRLECDKLGHD